MKLFLIVFIIVFIVVYFLFRSKGGSHIFEESPESKKFENGYEAWLDVFKKEKTNIHEFDLYGTKAAIAWNKEDSEVVVICITSFLNGKPITTKWDNYEFNIKEKYWTSLRPKGSPSRIREELKTIGLIS